MLFSKKNFIAFLFVFAAGAAFSCTFGAAREPQGNIVSFRLGQTGMARYSGFSYKANLIESGALVEVMQNGKFQKRIVTAESFMPGLEKLVREQKLYAWNGFKKSDSRVLDGDSFGMVIRYTTESITASGSNAYPKNYGKAVNAVAKYFNAAIAQAPVIKQDYTQDEVEKHIAEAVATLVRKKALPEGTRLTFKDFKAVPDTELSIINITVRTEAEDVLDVHVLADKVIALRFQKKTASTKEAVYMHRLDKIVLSSNEHMYNKILRGDLP